MNLHHYTHQQNAADRANLIKVLADIGIKCFSLVTQDRKTKNAVITGGGIGATVIQEKTKKKGGIKRKMQKSWFNYRTKEKRWQGRHKLPDGKIVYAYSSKGGTKKECADKLKAAILRTQEKYKKGLLSPKKKAVNPATDMTLNEWWDWWWENLGKYKYKLSTQNVRIHQYNSIIKDRIGSLKLYQIDEAVLTEFFAGLKNVTQKNNAKTILNILFDLAKDKNYIETNPMRFAVIEIKNRELANTRKKKEVLSPEDEKKLFELMKEHKIHDICKFILYSGLRKGEALALKWTDIDFDNCLINVDKNLDYINNVISQTKTESGQRFVPLFPQTKEVLAKLSLSVTDKSARIFKDVNGLTLTNTFQRFTKRLGLNIAIHNLRHTFATRCLEAGILPKVVQEWLGHKDYSVTINTYSHVTEQLENGEIAKMQGYFEKISCDDTSPN